MYVIETPGSLLFSAVRVLALVLPFGSKGDFRISGRERFFHRKNRDDLFFVIFLKGGSSSHNPPIRLPFICLWRELGYVLIAEAIEVGFPSLAGTTE